MCIKVNFFQQDLPVMSLTAGILMVEAIDLRNGPPRYERVMGTPEVIARRVAGALCFAGCIVAAVVENIVRVALALLLLLPSLMPWFWKNGKPEITIALVAIIALAPVLIVDLVLRNVYALGKIFTRRGLPELRSEKIAG